MDQVMVLGANGRLGWAAVQAFAAAGWRVLAQGRRAPRGPLPVGVRWLQADVLAVDTLAAAAGPGLDVLVHALNPDYTRWATELPPQTEAVLRLARATGATLMLPGNVYNFGRALPAVLDEATPFVADHPKAAQRIALEAALAAAAADGPGVRSIVVRAGDFLGDQGTWLDQAMARGLARGRFVLMGPAELPHAWAWLPDLAETFVRVAARRAALPPHAVLHFPGHTLSGAELQQAFEVALGRPLQRGAFPWGVVRAAAWLPGRPGALPRALVEMRHLWQRPHRLAGARLQALIGPPPQTPLAQVVAGCLAALPATARPAPVRPSGAVRPVG